MYLDNMDAVYERENWMFAEILAFLRNMSGGKPKPDDKRDFIDQQYVYTRDELMPWFARSTTAKGLSPHVAQAIIVNRKAIPGWAKQLIDFEQAESIAKNYQEVPINGS